MLAPKALSVAFATLACFAGEGAARALEALGKRQDGYHWVDTWTSMPQLVESSNMPPSPFVSRLPSHIFFRRSLFEVELRRRPQRRNTPPNVPHVHRRA